MPIDKDVLNARISDVRSALNELCRLVSKPFSFLSIDEKYSIRYNIVILVESLVSLCMHISMEAYSKTPSSYREAIQIVSERLGLSCTSDLGLLVGLRNLLVHRYWKIDDGKVYENIKSDFKCVEELLKKVEEEFLS